MRGHDSGFGAQTEKKTDYCHNMPLLNRILHKDT